MQGVAGPDASEVMAYYGMAQGAAPTPSAMPPREGVRPPQAGHADYAHASAGVTKPDPPTLDQPSPAQDIPSLLKSRGCGIAGAAAQDPHPLQDPIAGPSTDVTSLHEKDTGVVVEHGSSDLQSADSSLLQGVHLDSPADKLLGRANVAQDSTMPPSQSIQSAVEGKPMHAATPDADVVAALMDLRNTDPASMQRPPLSASLGDANGREHVVAVPLPRPKLALKRVSGLSASNPQDASCGRPADRLTKLAMVAGGGADSGTQSPGPQPKLSMKPRRNRRPPAKLAQASRADAAVLASASQKEGGPDADMDASSMQTSSHGHDPMEWESSPTHSKKPTGAGSKGAKHAAKSGRAGQRQGAGPKKRRRLDHNDDDPSQHDSGLSQMDFYPVGASLAGQRRWVDLGELRDGEDSPLPFDIRHALDAASPFGAGPARPLDDAAAAGTLKQQPTGDPTAGTLTSSFEEYVWMSEDHPQCACSSAECPPLRRHPPTSNESARHAPAGWVGATQLEEKLLRGQLPAVGEVQMWEDAARRTLQLTMCIRQLWAGAAGQLLQQLPQQQVVAGQGQSAFGSTREMPACMPLGSSFRSSTSGIPAVPGGMSSLGSLPSHPIKGASIVSRVSAAPVSLGVNPMHFCCRPRPPIYPLAHRADPACSALWVPHGFCCSCIPAPAKRSLAASFVCSPWV